MQWTDEGIVLGVKRHGESSVILELMTQERGRHLGLVRGGAGTRLWPASREVRPKQFLLLFGARSTFQETMLRVSDAALFGRPIIITNMAYRFMVSEQLAAIGERAGTCLERDEFEKAMSELARLRRPIDDFFDKVTVNCDEPELRENRLRLLSRIRATMNRVADFTQIEG